jgi:polar amino acid transport system substrate-binding protein
MRKAVLLVTLAGLLLMSCAEEDSTGAAGGGGGGSSKQSCDVADPPLFQEGVLTVATDRPAFPPWFKGSPKNYSGFEGEIANEIARRMDLDIKWVVEPFNRSYAPGSKDYDFDINEITITPEREQAVDFSDGYFDDNQGVLALKDSPVADATSIDDLKDAQLGAQVGTTSLNFIQTVVQPSKQPKIFDTTNDSKAALESGQIDAMVTDVVTTVYLRDFEIDNSVVVGQYPKSEQFGMLFQQGNPLVDCVNQVLDEMKSDGTLDNLTKEWLKDYLSVPSLEE